jgi:glycosyltransferase involved in cell wall biosynthesis
MTGAVDGKVSIIIPCYNSELWVVEAIESCITQTWGNVEVVVVDDGSTDGSLQLLKSFGNRIILETGPNRGANHARNRGLELSTGKYIKFLDSDDFLASGALAFQVSNIAATGADVCYGGWRHLKHDVTGEMRLFPVECREVEESVLAALLSRWWCPQFTYLYRRDFLINNGCRWDEKLLISQDFDFILGIALRGAKFCCVHDLVGTYRHHAGERVSRKGVVHVVEANTIILARAEAFLDKHEQMSVELRQIICSYYLHLAKMAFCVDRGLFRRSIDEITRLNPDFRSEKRFYDTIVKLIGFEAVEWLLEWRRRVRSRIDSRKDYYERS